MKHAVQARALSLLPIEVSLLSLIQNGPCRGLIDDLYGALIAHRATCHISSSKVKWQNYIPSIEDEEWEQAFQTPTLASPSLRERLIQVYILHRAYLMPHKQAKFLSDRPTL